MEEIQEMDEEWRAGAANVCGRLRIAGVPLRQTLLVMLLSQPSYFSDVSPAPLQKLKFLKYWIKQNNEEI